MITRKRVPVAAIVPYEDWAKKESSEKDGLAAAAGALADLDDDVEALVDAVYAARAKAKDRDARF